MTGAQILRAEGEAKGRAEGEAKGRAEVLLRLLRLKFDPVPEATVQLIHSAGIQQLDRWLDRVLNADAIDDVFSD